MDGIGMDAHIVSASNVIYLILYYHNKVHGRHTTPALNYWAGAVVQTHAAHIITILL